MKTYTIERCVLATELAEELLLHRHVLTRWLEQEKIPVIEVSHRERVIATFIPREFVPQLRKRAANRLPLYRERSAESLRRRAAAREAAKAG